MKILHVCLANFYIDNYGYQENVLPKMHKMLGYDVAILASTETYIDNKDLGYIKEGTFLNENGIEVTRIPYVKWLPKFLRVKLRLYEGVKNYLERFKPDILFIHDIQFLSVRQIVTFLKKNPQIKVYVDGHADFSNSARNFLSMHLLHKGVYKYCVKLIKPFVLKFYGTLPARVDFFVNVYGTSPLNTELLVMGADDEFVKKAKDKNIRTVVRKQFNIADDDLLLISGGKIDWSKKQTLNLMKAIEEINDAKVKLLIFGSVSEELNEDFNKLLIPNRVFFIGWLNYMDIYDYFEAADLVVFPGRHSVLWEQAVGQGKPCIFKHYPGHTHVDLSGNCKFLYNTSVKEIKETLLDSFKDLDLLTKTSVEKGIGHFSYLDIAKRAIVNENKY